MRTSHPFWDRDSSGRRRRVLHDGRTLTSKCQPSKVKTSPYLAWLDGDALSRSRNVSLRIVPKQGVRSTEHGASSIPSWKSQARPASSHTTAQLHPRPSQAATPCPAVSYRGIGRRAEGLCVGEYAAVSACTLHIAGRDHVMPHGDTNEPQLSSHSGHTAHDGRNIARGCHDIACACDLDEKQGKERRGHPFCGAARPSPLVLPKPHACLPEDLRAAVIHAVL